MRHTRQYLTPPPSSPLLTFTFLCLLLPSSLATSITVALSDFKPRASNLDPICKTIYNAPILGCSPNDFTSSGICSEGCIDALNALQQPVALACPDISGQNLLKATVDGLASVSLCRNGVGVGPLVPAPVAPIVPTAPAPTAPTPPAPIDPFTMAARSSWPAIANTASSVTSVLAASSSAMTMSTSTLVSSLTMSTSTSHAEIFTVISSSDISTVGSSSRSDTRQYTSTVATPFGHQTAFDGTPFDVMGSQISAANCSAPLGLLVAAVLATLTGLFSGFALMF